MRVAFSSIDWNTLQLAGRARDDAQHLGGRGLLLQRFGELLPSLGKFAPACFKLLFQLGLRFADLAGTCSRLRSGRTKLATLRLALRALARQDHPAAGRSTPSHPGHLKHIMQSRRRLSLGRWPAEPHKQ